MIDRFRLLNCFRFGFAGIRRGLRTEQNLRVHFLATAVTVGLGIWLDISAREWISIVICIGLVMGAELLNTAIEILCDRVNPEQDDYIRDAKDVAAGGVLVCALIAMTVGAIVFLPKLWNLVSG